MTTLVGCAAAIVAVGLLPWPSLALLRLRRKRDASGVLLAELLRSYVTSFVSVGGGATNQDGVGEGGGGGDGDGDGDGGRRRNSKEPPGVAVKGGGCLPLNDQASSGDSSPGGGGGGVRCGGRGARTAGTSRAGKPRYGDGS